MPGRRFRTRRNVYRGGGAIRVADDDRASPCYVCTGTEDVRFIQFHSPKKGDRMFLRICDGCLEVLNHELDALREA